jgi:hypothetical protein
MDEETFMKTTARKRARTLVVGMALALSGGALAAEQPPAKSTEPSQQTREQMAKMHEQMAACLRSDKAFEPDAPALHDCHGRAGLSNDGSGHAAWETCADIQG